MGDGGLIDDASDVVVRLSAGSLLSVETRDLLAGRNVAMVGGEIIGFRTASLQQDSSYRLSGLIRGLFGTPTDHGSNSEPFALVDSGLAFVDLEVSDLRRPIQVAVTRPSGDPHAVIPTRMRFEGWNARSCPVTAADIQRNPQESMDVTISWRRRARLNFRALYEDAPLVEATEVYDVVASNGRIWRRIPQPWIVYTAAEQVADGTSPGSPFSITVYQIDPITGRGRPATIEVPGVIQ